jgi:peptidoglycan/xylan/chitin deacetylase (PgdA/CDA1 family)
MKKRILAFLCAVLMIAQASSLPVQAAETVYFTAVNETILELSDTTMPFWSGGYLYVATNLFSNRELGLYYSYNAAKKTVVVYTTSRALIFDLDAGTVADGLKNVYYPPAVVKGSVIFLPVGLLSSFFDLTYTNKRVEHGYLIRLRSASSSLSDSMFLDAGAFQLESRYNQYQASQLTTNPAPVTDTPAAPAETGRQTIYLCFQITDIEQTSALLDVLTAQSAHAAFYATAQQIRSGGDLMRHLAAAGQSVGLMADAGNPDATMAEQLQAGNAALQAATGMKTRLCMIENADEAALSDATAAGYSCLSPDLDRSAYGLQSTSNANYLLSRVSARRGAVSVWLGDQTNTAGLRAFLSAAREEDDTFRGITEAG